MVVLELNKVEIDHCLSCGGIWLDSGELELLLEDSQKKQDLLDSFRADRESKEKPRRCPICLRAMEKILCGKEKSVLIDRCRKGHGLWFDAAELHEVIAMGSIDKDNKVLSLLEDMFRKSGE
jgi:hypothetical protein